LGLFKITKAPIIPGIQPQSVNKKIITKEPQPLSITESGGKITAKITLKIFIVSIGWLLKRRIKPTFVTY